MGRNEDIILHKLSNRYGMSLNELRKVVYSQFHLTRKEMASGEMNTVILPYMGKFRPKQKKDAEGETSGGGE